MITFRHVTLLALGVLTLSLTPGDSSAAPATPAATTGPPPSTALVVTATNSPQRVAGSDGSDHLEYDLIVTNGFTAPATLTTVDVLGPDGRTLLQLSGNPLVQATQPLLGQTPTKSIPASGTVAVVVDVVVPHDQPLDRLTHRITYAVASDAPGRSLLGSFTIDGPALTVDPRPAIVLAPPLRGEGWLVINGCCPPSSIHRSIRIPAGGSHLVKAETFAIDWVQLRNGKLFTGDGARNEQWFGFGAPVYAVAAGTVDAGRDGRPEETPGQPGRHGTQPVDDGGTMLLLAIAPGVSAFSAPVRPDSLTVKIGDRSTTGQLRGQRRTPGTSPAPHLPVGLLDLPAPWPGHRRPLVGNRGVWQGTLTSAAAAGAFAASAAPAEGPASPGAVPALLDQTNRRSEIATLPLDLTVADFGA